MTPGEHSSTLPYMPIRPFLIQIQEYVTRLLKQLANQNHATYLGGPPPSTLTLGRAEASPILQPAQHSQRIIHNTVPVTVATYTHLQTDTIVQRSPDAEYVVRHKRTTRVQKQPAALYYA